MDTYRRFGGVTMFCLNIMLKEYHYESYWSVGPADQTSYGHEKDLRKGSGQFYKVAGRVRLAALQKPVRGSTSDMTRILRVMNSPKP